MDPSSCAHCGAARPVAGRSSQRSERSPADVVSIQLLTQEVQHLRETVARLRGSLGVATTDVEHRGR